MADTTFTPGTLIESTWLNEVNDTVYNYLVTDTGATAHTLQSKLRERMSVKDFGAVGDGVTDDTQAFLAAFEWANNSYANLNFRPTIDVPPGSYLTDPISLNSYRGITIVGAGTEDPVRRRTTWKMRTTGSALLSLISCAYMTFEGIYFDINSIESTTALVLFQGNDGAGTILPYNRFSNNWIEFKRCSFYVQPTIVAKPVQAVWVKSAAMSIFTKCSFFGGAPNAVRIGADTDVDPSNGAPTFANGKAVHTVFYNCYFNGDVCRENSYFFKVFDCEFYLRNDNNTQNSRITTSGNKFSMLDTIDGCQWDRTGVSDFNGTLIESGDAVGCGGMRIVNSQLDGRKTLVKVNQGSADITNCRPISNGGLTGQIFVHIGASAESVTVGPNVTDGYFTANNGGIIRARLVVDDRTSQFLPTLANSTLATATTLPAAGAWQGLLSADYKFGGQRVRITYSVSIQHKDASTLRSYTSRVTLDGVAIPETQRRISLKELDEYGTISCTALVYIDAVDLAKTLQLEVQQASGTTYGIVQSTATNPTGSGWTVELIES